MVEVIKRKMKQKKEKEEGVHEVSINITIAKASIAEYGSDGKRSELPQVQNYFHCQYKLLPDDRDFVKTDVVTFGMAAKMYGDNDSKVLRTWIDGDRTWVAWTNNRKLRVTQEVLLKLFQHKFELKVWDTKDKVSAKARFDRPKAFRLPQTKNQDEVDLDVIRNMMQQDGKEIIHLGSGSSSLLNQDGSISDRKKKKKQAKKVSFVGNYNSNTNVEQSSHQFISTTSDKVEVKVRLDKDKQPEFKNLLTLASTGDKPLPVDTEEVDRIKKFESANNKSSSNDNRRSPSRERSNSSRQSPKKSRESPSGKRRSPMKDQVSQNGLACITVPLSSLFTNCLSISNTLKEPVSTLDEVIVILSLDKPLLSEYQRYKLNPMVLTVKSANQMPNNGMDYDELKTKCFPPYIKYKFFGCKEHKSIPKDHGKTIKVNDNNVILLGTLDKANLFEYLRGPALKIEVHDRDKREVPQKKSSVFGAKPEDENIFNSAYAGGNLNHLLSNHKLENNYGVAEFDLSELLDGERSIHLVAPIRANHRSLINTSNENSATAVPCGDYLESGSELKIKIQLIRSLTEAYIPPVPSQVSSGNSLDEIERSAIVLNESRYGRIVYIFDYNNKSFLGKILKLTTDINAKALNLSSYPLHVVEAALSTYKLSDEQKEDKTLDIITGCQVIDGEHHIFVLEGLGNAGIKRLWDELEHPTANSEVYFRVLYNSEMSFSGRIYVSLDVDLTRIRLHQPISNIVKQPLLYIRDILPRNCFQAITKLHQLCQVTSLQNVIRNDLLPTVPMIVSLGREFGVPLTEEDLHEVTQPDLNDGELGVSPQDVSNDVNIKTSRRPPLDMDNEAYDKLITERKLGNVQPIDYVNANIKSLLTLSRAKVQENNVVTCDDIEVAHNYSSQHLNSTSMALEKLRKQLGEDKNERYTYCQQFNGATLHPTNIEEKKKLNQQMEKEQWKSRDGFVYPGMKSAIESNHHPLRLHVARLNELEKPWRENILHANNLKPSVERILFKLVDRDEDFNTWTKPPKYFTDGVTPVTIHAAGDTLANEQMDFKRKEMKNWRDKLVVSNPRCITHRCLAATELTSKGFASSNQIDRKQGLLKDPPMKYAFVKPGLYLQPIPPTDSILEHPAEEGREKNVGFQPGDSENASCIRDINCIPIRDYQHEHFEKTKGHDFSLVHTNREKVGMKRTELTNEEKKTHLFL